MKQFLVVLKFELNNYFKNKSFLLTTAVLALLVAGVVLVPTMIPALLGNDKKDDGLTGTNEQSYGVLGIVFDMEKPIEQDTVLALFPAEWTVFETKAELKDAVEKETVEAGFVWKDQEIEYVVNNLAMDDYLAETFAQSAALYQKQQYLQEQGLTPEQFLEAESIDMPVSKTVLGKDSMQNYWYTYVLVFVVYMLIIFYGQMIATSITTEKSNRAIEILVTSVNSNSLIFGKVLAGAIAGVGQATVILGSGFAAYSAVGEKWGGMLDFLFEIPADVFGVYIIFALLSYVLYAFLFGTLGALVSKTEDISKSSMPVTLIYVASFIIAMLGMTESDSMLMKVASFIPFTSGNAMFIRASMGSVTGIEIILSVALLLATCVLTGILAAKLFRFGTLHYGNPIKIKTALKNVFGEK